MEERAVRDDGIAMSQWGRALSADCDLSNEELGAINFSESQWGRALSADCDGAAKVYGNAQVYGVSMGPRFKRGL